MRRKIIPQIEPWLGKEEIREVTESIKTQWISGGPKLKKFQQKIAKLCQVKYAVATCNGTQALYIGLKILGIDKGDEVIVPDFTFIASANAVVWAGGKPVFVDVDAKTLNIDPAKIEKAITKRTKAIMPVHIYGQAAKIPEICKIAKKHKLYVIEDAAQGIGVTYNGKPVGGFGDVGCLSFYSDKVITTGEGGMVLTNNKKLATKAIILLNQGRTSRGWYVHDYIGYNFRMNDLQASVGLAQLKKLPRIIKRKIKNENLYRKYLADIPEVKFIYVDKKVFQVPYRSVIFVNDPQILMEFLNKNGIKTTRTFFPLHLQPCFTKKGNMGDRINLKIKGNFSNTISAYERILNLPSGANLTEKEIRYVCQKIKEFFGRK